MPSKSWSRRIYETVPANQKKEEPMELYEMVEKINTKEDFIEFAKQLRDDKVDEEEKEKLNPSSPYDKGKNGWENNSIPDFLDSIIAFGEDSDSINQKASWKDFALLLFAGKFYE